MPVLQNKSVVCPILVGRATQLESLTHLIHQVQDGSGQIALISGEAGIGKSRLASEAKTLAQRMSFSILEGHCFEPDRTLPYAPFVDLLDKFFTMHAGDEISRTLVPGASELVKLLPELATLSSDSTPTLSIEPEQEKRRLFQAIAQWFAQLAAQQPLLVIVEDLHWSDETSLEVLLYLARRLAARPILLLMTYRTEEASSSLTHFLAEIDRARLGAEIELTPLTMQDVDAMLRAIFNQNRLLRAEFLDAIYAQTEGNPFFIEEVLKSLITAGEIFYADGIWNRKPMGDLHIPRSVHDAVRRRVAQLTEPAHRLLILAAVAGRRFDFTLLQVLNRSDENDLLKWIKETITAQLVVEESAEQFAFRHMLTRQAVYAELLARERKTLHRTVLEAMEQLYAESPDLPRARANTYLADLAYHAYEAEAWEKALTYSERAGARAQALYAPRETVEHFTRALDAARRLSKPAPASLYRARGQAYELLGSFTGAHADYEQALNVARDAQDGVTEWQSLIDLGFLWAGRDYTQAGVWYRRASDQAAHLADPNLRARSLNRFGNWLLNTGRMEEGLQAHQEALEIFEGQQNTQGMAETLDLLGITYGMRGDRVKAVELLGQAITLFRTLGDTQSLVSSLAMRALQSMPGASETTFCPLRTQNECVQDASEALRLARQIDSLAGQAFAENALAHILLSFGEFGPALSHAQEAQRIATEIEHQQWMIATYHCFGHIYSLLLAPVPAVTALEAGLSLAQELGSTFWITTLAADLGRVYVLKHDLPAARATLQAVMPREQHPRNVAERDIALIWGELALAQGEPEVALQIAEQLLASAPGKRPGQPTQPIPHLLKLKGEAFMALSRLDEAVEALEDAKRGAQERNVRPILWTVHRSLGQVYQLLQHNDQARQERATARQLIKELAATIDDASLREQYERTALDFFPKEKLPLPREAAKQAFGGLTVREREVAALIAQGKTSREIADLLVVSERTAEVHVSNILRKLGFASRAQIAVWAAARGLVNH